MASRKRTRKSSATQANYAQRTLDQLIDALDRGEDCSDWDTVTVGPIPHDEIPNVTNIGALIQMASIMPGGWSADSLRIIRSEIARHLGVSACEAGRLTIPNAVEASFACVSANQRA